jgi:hypothetical protein
MKNNSTLGEELLKQLGEDLFKQNGARSANAADDFRQKVFKMVQEEELSLKRSKRRMVWTWRVLLGYTFIFFLSLFIWTYTTERGTPFPGITFGYGLINLFFWMAVVFTVIHLVNYLFRSRSANLHQIQLQLANMEEQLRKLKEDQKNTEE